MNTYVLATPIVLGLLAVAVPLDSTALLNQATDWTLRRQGLLGDRLAAQAYGPLGRQRLVDQLERQRHLVAGDQGGDDRLDIFRRSAGR